MIKTGKIINDPVQGFVSIPEGLISGLVQHPYFQRLRDIKQLGLTNLVYPGASHSRLSHALGAMHLMNEALTTLSAKGAEITSEEWEAALVAILLHDIGHGPFSHALEYAIVKDVSHEEISLKIMNELNKSFSGSLDLAMSVFEGTYHKSFLHQLVSSQLDVDRLDYLKRDSFFSGVAEGMIGIERILKMMYVNDNNLVIESKGIYSVEKFLISRRLMYWQVYLHKTVVAAEQLLIQILKRARYLCENGCKLSGSPALIYFLSERQSVDFTDKDLMMFTRLDDSDIMSAVKQWQFSNDKILENLCKMLTSRRLPKITLSREPFLPEVIEQERMDACSRWQCEMDEVGYYVQSSAVANKGYDSDNEEIRIYSKSGTSDNIFDISDMLSAKAFSQITKKYFLCTAK